MKKIPEEENKALVLEAFDTLFNKREHCDVLQDEATLSESQSGLPMFGNEFPA
jgi:hypothetical protein